PVAFRIPHGRDRFPTEFSDSEPDHQRYVPRGVGGRGSAVQRVGDYGQTRHGSRSRSLCSTRKYHFQSELGTEPAHQAGRETGAGLERRGGGSSAGDAPPPDRARQRKIIARKWLCNFRGGTSIIIN